MPIDEVKLNNLVQTELRNIVTPVIIPLSHSQLEKAYESITNLSESKCMDLTTLKAFSRSLDIDEMKAERIFEKMDEDKNGYLDFDEFCKLIRYLTLRKLRNGDEIYFDTIFKMIDLDGSGEIDSRELGAFIRQMVEMNDQERESSIYHKEKVDAPVMVPNKDMIKFLEHSFGHPMEYEEWILRLFKLNALK